MNEAETQNKTGQWRQSEVDSRQNTRRKKHTKTHKEGRDSENKNGGFVVFSFSYIFIYLALVEFNTFPINLLEILEYNLNSKCKH